MRQAYAGTAVSNATHSFQDIQCTKTSCNDLSLSLSPLAVFLQTKASDPTGGFTAGVWVRDSTPPTMIFVRSEAVARTTPTLQVLHLVDQKLQLKSRNLLFRSIP